MVPQKKEKKLSGDLAWGIPREMEVAVAQVVWTRALIGENSGLAIVLCLAAHFPLVFGPNMFKPF